MTTENLTKEQRENILKAAEIIRWCNKGFIWYKTKEGENYWNGVVNALERIANSKPKVKKFCSECGRELE